MDEHEWLAEQFEANRTHLRAVAYRMLGDLTEADDAVQDALVDEWTGTAPWRILCEVYARLLAMVLQHWVLLLACWDDPHRSLSGAAEVLREQVPVLVHGVMRHLPLQRALRLVVHSVRGGCSIPQRSTRLSTSRRLQGGSTPGLT